MLINSIASQAATQSQSLNKANARLQTAIASLVSGNRLAQASTDVAALSVASGLQSQVAGLRQASTNVAQSSSLVQVADGALGQIAEVAGQLQNIAQQASSPTITDAGRQALNEQFKQLTQEIDRLAGNTQFGGRNLLDGSLSGENSLSLDGLLAVDGEAAGEGDALALDNFSSATLLGGSFDVLSADNAQAALEALGAGLQQITGARANVGSFQGVLDYAGANLESAIFNQDAARSVLTDADFAEASTNRSQALLQQNAALSLAAQGNRLAPSLLQLLT